LSMGSVFLEVEGDRNGHLKRMHFGSITSRREFQYLFLETRPAQTSLGHVL
jgi:hypothetical protein